MSLEDDMQALSSQLDDLQHSMPRLVEALDNLSGVVEGLAGDLADALSQNGGAGANTPPPSDLLGPGTTRNEPSARTGEAPVREREPR